jgi:uncharacterized membrane protein
MKKALIKTITYRALGSLTGLVITYLATGDFKMGVLIGGADIIIKPILYYLHELVWESKSNKEIPNE